MYSAKIFKCSLCSKTFKFKSSLKIHILNHLNWKQIKSLSFQKPFMPNENTGIHTLDKTLKFHSSSGQKLVSPKLEAAGEENFKCHFCIKTFNSHRRLRWHLRCHNSGKPFKCHLCSSSFRYIGSLKAHLDVHANGKPHGCHLCTESFSFRKELYEHTITHFDEEKLHRCHVCGKAFRQRGTLKAHMVTHATNPFKCNICSKAFNHSGSLRRHMALHSDEKLFKCPMCPRSYRLQNSLKVHIVSHFKQGLLKCKDRFRSNIHRKGTMSHESLFESAVIDSTLSKFRCKLCAEKFPSRSDLKLHMILHLDGDQLRCLLCFRSYNDDMSFKRHMSQHFLKFSSNANQKEIVTSYQGNKSTALKDLANQNKESISGHTCRCSKCAEEFQNEDELASHMCAASADKSGNNVFIQKHVDMPKQNKLVPLETSFQCDVCYKTFRSESSLKKHEKVHSAKKQFKCHLCSRLFTFYNDLRKHMSRHVDGKTYTCSVCSEIFEMREDLQEHIITHSDEKGLYKCHECQRVYINRYGLMIHMQSHSNEKLYKCGLCERSFKHIQNLQQHLTDEHCTVESFKCQFCTKVFKDLQSLKQHSVLHSVDKSYSCSMCHMEFEIPEELESHMFLHNSGFQNFTNHVTEGSSDSAGDFQSGFSFSEEDLSHHEEDSNSENKREANDCSLKRVGKASMLSASNCSSNHLESKSWKCDLCHKRFQSKKFLKIHMVFHFNEKPYQCHVCFKFFRHFSNLSRHLTRHLEVKPQKNSNTGDNETEHAVKTLFKCSVCPRTFALKTALCDHFLMHIDDGKLFKCHLCTKSFTDRNRLRSHLRIHSNFASQVLHNQVVVDHTEEKPVKYRFFTKMAKNKSKTKPLNIHAKSRIRDKSVSRTVVCKFCSKDFPKLYTLKWHMTEHLFEAAMTAVSSERESMDADEVVEDENMVHLDVSAFNCHICKANFGDEIDLVEHLSTHSSNKSPDSSGRVIGIIRNKIGADREIEFEESTDFKFYKCRVCLKEFETELELIEHKGLHEDKSFRCHICMTKFKWKDSLDLHLSSHLKEKPFKCHLCSKSFIFKLNLRQHMYQHLDKSLFRYQRYTSKDDYNQIDSAKKVKDEKRELDILCGKLQTEQQLCEGKLLRKCHDDSLDFENSSTKLNKSNLGSQVMIQSSRTAAEGLQETFPLKAEILTQRTEAMNTVPNKQATSSSVGKEETGMSLTVEAEHLGKGGISVENLVANTDYSRNKAQAGDSSPFVSSEVLGILKSNKSQATKYDKTKPLEMIVRGLDHHDHLEKDIRCVKQEHENSSERRMQGTKDEDIFECHLCPKSFRIKWQLKYHLISHSNERPFKCHLCPKSFKYSSAYKRHVWQYTHDKRTSKRRFECHICMRSFIEKTHLKLHLITHSEKKAFRCEICSKSYKHRFSLRRHKFEEHDDREPFRCRICSKVLKNRRNLNNHMALHPQESVQEYKNSVLDCNNIQPEILKNHEVEFCENSRSPYNEYSMDSDIDEPNENRICDETDGGQSDQLERQEISSGDYTELKSKDSVWITEFENLGDLTEKIDSSGDVIWRCKVCGRTAKSKANLKWHMLTHSDKRHFKCTFCPKKYKYSSTLNRHMDLKHPQERDNYVAERPEEVLEDVDTRRVASESKLGSQNTRYMHKPSHKCVVCKLRFAVDDDYMEHLATHFHV